MGVRKKIIDKMREETKYVKKKWRKGEEEKIYTIEWKKKRTYNRNLALT